MLVTFSYALLLFSSEKHKINWTTSWPGKEDYANYCHIYNKKYEGGPVNLFHVNRHPGTWIGKDRYICIQLENGVMSFIRICLHHFAWKSWERCCDL